VRPFKQTAATTCCQTGQLARLNNQAVCKVIDCQVSSCDAKVGLRAVLFFGFHSEERLGLTGAWLRASQR
jgi:hypothetical protein